MGHGCLKILDITKVRETVALRELESFRRKPQGKALYIHSPVFSYQHEHPFGENKQLPLQELYQTAHSLLQHWPSHGEEGTCRMSPSGSQTSPAPNNVRALHWWAAGLGDLLHSLPAHTIFWILKGAGNKPVDLYIHTRSTNNLPPYWAGRMEEGSSVSEPGIHQTPGWWHMDKQGSTLF